MKELVYLVTLVGWILGFLIAKGFWSTVFCIIPFWSYYLVIEHYVVKYGLL